MNERQNRILILLSQSDAYLTSIEIADAVEVTHKTVQSDIKQLEQYLKTFDLEIESKRGSGYQIVFDSADKRIRFENEMLRQKLLHNDEARGAFVVCNLALYPNGLNAFYFHDILELTETEFTRLIDGLNMDLKRHFVSVGKEDQRIILYGTEHHIRFAYNHFMVLLRANPVLFSLYHSTYEKLIKDNHKKIIGPVMEAVSKNGINLTEESQNKLADYLDIQDHRYRQGMRLEQGVLSLAPLAGELAIDMEACSPYLDACEIQMLTFMIEFLVDKMFVVVNRQEVMDVNARRLIERVNDYFVSRLGKHHYLFSDVSWVAQKVENAVIVIQLQNRLGYFDATNEILTHDPEFVVALELASHLISRIESTMGERFYRENVFVLAQIINVNFVNNIWAINQELEIYSRHSISNAHLLKRNLERRFGDRINAYGVRSLGEDEKERIAKPIVITDDLIRAKRKNGRAVYSKSLLDYDFIGNALEQIVDEDDFLAKKFMDFFSRNRSSFADEATNIGQIIAAVTAKYGVNEDLARRIERNIFSRERRYLSVVHNGIALPRVFLEELDRPIIEVIIPRNSFTWNDKLVKVVMVIVLPRSFYGVQYLGKPLLKLIDNKEGITKLAQCKDYEQFIKNLEMILGQ